MPSATLRARMGVTAACVLAGFGLTLAPAFTATAGATSARATLGSSNQIVGSFTKSPASQRRHRTSHAARRAREMRLVHAYDGKVHRVLAEARRQRGKPYVYGADGPGAFDCSGLVRYVFMHSVHRYLPHNAAEQYHSLHHIRRSQLRKGDLIFTDNGYISHVGIFAGHHHWWVAPHTGTHVQKQLIYRAHFVYARVLRIHHS